MIEDELRDLFGRHEHLVPDARAVLPGIEQGYRRRRRTRLGFRAAGASLLIVALLGGSAYATGKVNGSDPRRTAGPATSATPTAAGPMNVLVLGLDKRDGENPDHLMRSDIVAIVHIPASRDQADVVTIERDTRVSIPADPASGHAATTDKINTAYAWGGAQLAARTIEQNFGIHIDATATFTFEGLRQVIDLIGGVDLYVDARTTSIHIGFDKHGKMITPAFVFGPSGKLVPVHGVTPVVYQVGNQHLQGWQAVDYARQRLLIDGAAKGGYARDRHVRQLIQAVVKKIMSQKFLDDPAKAQTLVDMVRNGGGALDTGGSTLAVLTALAGGVSTIVGIGAPGTTTPDSKFEVLTADGKALLDAVKGDTVDAWIAAHPDLIDVNH